MFTVLLAAPLGLIVLLAGPAFGHTELTSATPASGARLDKPPRQVRLILSESIAPEFAQVTLTCGSDPPEQLRTTVAGPVVEASVPRTSTQLGRVTWTIAYRVVSADGHPVTGSLEFRAPLGVSPPPRQRSPESPTPQPSTTARPEALVESSSDATPTTAGASPRVPVAALLLAGAGLMAGLVTLWRRRFRQPR
jgi:methionine-rich copper-binding protein CopC